MLPTRRTDRLHRAVDRTCRAIIRGYDEDAILSDCCRYLVDEGGYQMAWAGLSSYDEPARILPKAHAGFIAGDGVDPQAEASQTLLQATARSCVGKRSPQFVRPLEPKPSNGDTAPHQILEGQLTVCAVPLELGPHGQGALALGSEDQDAFNAEEVALLRDLANDLGHGISMLMDRAIAQQRQDQLLQDREFHASLFTNTPEGAFVATAGGMLVQANPAFARSLGYPDAEALLADPSASLYTIVAPKDKTRLMAALEDDAAPRTHDVTMRRKDNTSVQVRVTVHPIQGPQRSLLQAFVHDLTVLPEQASNGSGSAAPSEGWQTTSLNGDAETVIDGQGPTAARPPHPRPQREPDRPHKSTP